MRAYMRMLLMASWQMIAPTAGIDASVVNFEAKRGRERKQILMDRLGMSFAIVVYAGVDYKRGMRPKVN